jgi:2-haloacid dehalogenase
MSLAKSPTKKNVVFDVVGTCVSYDAFYDAIDERLGDKLRQEGIKPKLLGFAWQEAAEREYTYLSMSGAYVPFWKVFQPLFYRMLWMAGIAEPRKFCTDEDSLYMVEAYKRLNARPGLEECFKKLRGAGFTVWALTSGDVERVRGYFIRNGVEMPLENFVSCDTLGVGKPAPGAYTPLLEKFEGGEKPWFAAAHTWDAGAARRNG